MRVAVSDADIAPLVLGSDWEPGQGVGYYTSMLVIHGSQGACPHGSTSPDRVPVHTSISGADSAK